VRYVVARQIAPMGSPAGATAASITASWADRSGATQRVTLESILDGSDAALSGAFTLALPPTLGVAPR
jgi:hypothetical protein